MKKAVAERWVAALRSGKYRQIKGRLVTPLGHCCLGVLCELAIEDGKLLRHDLVEKGYLPETVQHWAGMVSRSGHVSSPGQANLAWLNDNGEADFNVIADVIEQHWEVL